jgi:hypothetical protein
MAKISAYPEEVNPNPAAEVVIAYAGANFRVKLSNVPAKAWTAFTPVWTGLTVGDGTNTGRQVQIGKTVFVVADFTFGATSAITGAVSMNCPVVAAAAAVRPIGGLRLNDISVQPYQGFILLFSTTLIRLRVANVAGTYPIDVELSSIIPFTWAAGDIISLNGFYEAA